MTASYWCCIISRDGADTIGKTIDSILGQSIPPEYVIVVNDGSSDNTEEIVSEKSKTTNRIHIVNTNSRTRDIRRVPRLLNLGIAHSVRFPATRYMMVSGDDNELTRDYAEVIMQRMDENNIVVASGDWLSSSGRANQMPHGGGMFVRMDFTKHVGGK